VYDGKYWDARWFRVLGFATCGYSTCGSSQRWGEILHLDRNGGLQWTRISRLVGLLWRCTSCRGIHSTPRAWDPFVPGYGQSPPIILAQHVLSRRLCGFPISNSYRIIPTSRAAFVAFFSQFRAPAAVIDEPIADLEIHISIHFGEVPRTGTHLCQVDSGNRCEMPLLFLARVRVL